METNDVISFTEKYIVGCVMLFVKTLAHPIGRLTTSTNDTTAIDRPLSHPPLLAFVLISIFLGSILNLFVPARKYSGDIVGKVIVVLALWFFFTAYTHALCRIFRGKAKIEQTFWVSLQVFAALFVASSFVNLIGGVFVRHPQVSSFLVSTGKLGDSIANNPFYIYFLVQFILLNVYLPLGIKRIHNFGWKRPFLVGIALSLFWVWLGILFLPDIGIKYLKPYG